MAHVTLASGQYEVELEPGLLVTRTVPSVVNDQWRLTWVFTGRVMRERMYSYGDTVEAHERYFEFVRTLFKAISLRKGDGEPLSTDSSGHGDDDDHEVMIRLPLGLTDALHVRYVWGSEVGRETVSLTLPESLGQ